MWIFILINDSYQHSTLVGQANPWSLYTLTRIIDFQFVSMFTCSNQTRCNIDVQGKGFILWCLQLFRGEFPEIERLYFDPSLFPPPNQGEWSDNNYPWLNLKHNVEIAVLKCGNTVISNGGGARNKSGSTIRWFQCGNCYCCQHSTSMEQILDLPYCNS